MRYDCYEMARPKCYETAALKQKAYRERKKNLSVSVPTEPKRITEGVNALTVGEAREDTLIEPSTDKATDSCGGQNFPFETKKVGEFRMLVLPEHPKDEPVVPVVKPLIFRDDNGRVISERAWNAFQKLKEKAKGIYEIDDYIQ